MIWLAGSSDLEVRSDLDPPPRAVNLTVVISGLGFLLGSGEGTERTETTEWLVLFFVFFLFRGLDSVAG